MSTLQRVVAYGNIHSVMRQKKTNKLVMEMAQLLQHGRSLTVKIRCHLSRNNSCTDAIFIDHWRAAHKSCKKIHTFMLFCINS